MKKTITHPLALLSLACPVILVLLLARFLGSGFEQTDDSYYILFAQQPQNISASISQFAYYTQWLYRAAAGDITTFRVLGAVVVFLVSILFSYFFLLYLKNHFTSRDDLIIPFALLLSAGLAFYFWRWYPGPSYNWLNLNACLLAGSGMLGFVLFSKRRVLFLMSGLLLGLGLTLSFLAKPTTAILLFTGMLWWLHLNWNRNAWLFIAGASASSLSLFAWHIYVELDGLSVFLQNLSLGLEYSRTLQSRHGLPELAVRAIQGIVIGFGAGILLVLSFIKLFSISYFQKNSSVSDSGYMQAVLFPVVAVSLVALAVISTNPGSVLAASYLALISTYSYFYLFKIKTDTSVNSDVVTKTPYHSLAPVILLLGLNFSYGFGSNLAFSKILSGAYIFLVAACIYLSWLFDRFYSCRKFSTVTYLFIIISLVLLVSSEIIKPYRLSAGLHQQTVTAKFYDDYTSLNVDPNTADYINGLNKLGRENGWSANTPLIDMTGNTPGALLILNAKVPGRPWFLGKYPGANEFVTRVLSEIPREDVKKAWLLTTNDSPLKIDEAVLQQFEQKFPEDYMLLGEIITSYREEKQFLWKPVFE